MSDFYIERLFVVCQNCYDIIGLKPLKDYTVKRINYHCFCLNTTVFNVNGIAECIYSKINRHEKITVLTYYVPINTSYIDINSKTLSLSNFNCFSYSKERLHQIINSHLILM